MKIIEFESDQMAKNMLGRLTQWGYRVEVTAEGEYFVPSTKADE